MAPPSATKAFDHRILHVFLCIEQATLGRESTVDSGRGRSFKSMTPPIITTTAATPQDSPSTTIEHGLSICDWDKPSLLKPPSIVGSVKALNSLLSPEHHSNKKKLESSVLRSSIGVESKSTAVHARIDASKASRAESPESKAKAKAAAAAKKRTSVKKRKDKGKCDSDTEVLNNGRIGSIDSSNKAIKSTKRIQNNTKNTNKISPQSKQVIGTADVEMFDNSPQFYQYIEQQQQQASMQPTQPQRLHRDSCTLNQRRRMSTMDPNAFHKLTNLDIQNMQNFRKSSHRRGRSLHSQESRKSNASSKQADTASVNIVMSEPFKFTSKAIRRRIEQFTKGREEYSLYLFAEDNKFRGICDWFVTQKWFDNVILLFIALNCITLAMERPNIPPNCPERYFLMTANYVFTVVFTIEMFVKVVATGMFYGHDAYFNSGWNIMDGSLVIISIIDLLMSLLSHSSPRIFGILRVFRLLRSLRPLRVINRAPGLKLVVQTLLSSLRPIGNIVLICCTFFIIFGILGVQLFKGTFFYCEGVNIKNVKNKTDCLSIPGNVWINRKYNFDDLGKALMSLFVLSSRDGWVNIMYTGLDAVGVDQQPIVNFNEWRLLYFIAFILLVGFFVLNMFVGVVVENFHRCREEQEKEEKIRRAAKRAVQMEKKRKRKIPSLSSTRSILIIFYSLFSHLAAGMHEPPYYTNYSPLRLFVHNVVTSKYFDLAIAAVIGLNVVTMALEYYMMPIALEYALKIFNYFFTAVFILEAIMKLVALGFKIYMKDKWNQLDVGIVMLSVVGIVLEELETKIIPINPTIIRVMRVLRIARVLKLLKMAKGIRALLDTVMQALPQVGNLGLLFFLLFFIFAALGVELFGRLECSDEHPCQGLGEHAHFANFGMAFLTLFRVATGDNWNGIMKDTLRDECDDEADCVRNCCVSSIIAPIFFVIFVLMAQFVLVNVVVAVLMKHLEESHKQMEDELDMETELEREFQQEQEFEEEQALCLQLQEETAAPKRPIPKVLSLPSNFTYSTPIFENKYTSQRRQTVQYFNQASRMADFGYSANVKDERHSFSEVAENEFELNKMKGRKASVSNSGNICPGPDKHMASGRKTQWKPKFDSRDTSLDETHNNSDVKRNSCDQLYAKVEKNANFYQKVHAKQIEKASNKNLAEKLNTSKESIGASMPATITVDSTDRKPLPKMDYAISNAGNAFLLLPKMPSTINRSGSCKQLFKQHALDEDPDIDENSLLLPVLTTKIVQPTQDYKNAKETSLFTKETNDKPN